MLERLWDITGANVYYQHAICLTNDPVIMFFYIVGDMLTFLSYMVIGGTLLWHRVKTIRFTEAALKLYGTFIILCGLSHLTKTLTLFVGIYRVDIIVVVAMAAVSVVTAIKTAIDVTESEARMPVR